MCAIKKILCCSLLVLSFNGLFPQSHFEIRRLSINTQATELGPAFYRSGLVFCSDRRQDFFMSHIDMNDNLFSNLYLADQKKPGKFERPRLFAKELTTILWDGPPAFSRGTARSRISACSF